MDISKKLRPYMALADMIADSFANRCEVVIHDLSSPQNSVVHVSNGVITDRQIGQSFDHLIKEVLLSRKFKNDYNANYTFKLENGKVIKSSTALIRDENDEVIGAFCINFEIDELTKMQAFLNDFLPGLSGTDDAGESAATDTYENVSEIIDSLIDKTIGNIDITQLKRKDNIELLTFMHDKGIFLAKGSIDKVAARLSISPVTVYAYLDEIKKKKKRK